MLSIPEMMRLLIDEHQFSWDDAFEVFVRSSPTPTNTLMSEALETSPVDMLGKILPRHLQIIFEINDYFLKTCRNSIRTIPICWDGRRSLMNPTVVVRMAGWRLWWFQLTVYRNCTLT